MQEHKAIQNIPPHAEINGIYILSAASQHQARNGPFWKIELRDATGSIEAKIWSPLSQNFSELPTGTFVEIQGRTDMYRDQIQMNIESLRLLSLGERDALDMALYVPSSPFDTEDMWQELEDLCRAEFTHKPWLDFAFSVFKNIDIRFAWMACPAAKNVHHAYRGGLLEHSLSVAKLAMSIAKHYPELDRQALLAGAIFHDIGKIWEFSYGVLTDYTTEGRLLGHMHLALENLLPHMEEAQLEEEYRQHFKHLILSHHGSYEFGSARVPQTPEAMLLHYVDNIDAKMAQCRQIFTSFSPEEEGWSDYQRTLERYMYQPLRTPRLLQAPPAPLAPRAVQEPKTLPEQEIVHTTASSLVATQDKPYEHVVYEGQEHADSSFSERDYATDSLSDMSHVPEVPAIPEYFTAQTPEPETEELFPLSETEEYPIFSASIEESFPVSTAEESSSAANENFEALEESSPVANEDFEAVEDSFSAIEENIEIAEESPNGVKEIPSAATPEESFTTVEENFDAVEVSPVSVKDNPSTLEENFGIAEEVSSISAEENVDEILAYATPLPEEEEIPTLTDQSEQESQERILLAEMTLEKIAEAAKKQETAQEMPEVQEEPETPKAPEASEAQEEVHQESEEEPKEGELPEEPEKDSAWLSSQEPIAETPTEAFEEHSEEMPESNTSSKKNREESKQSFGLFDFMKPSDK